jgi:hypothetical protein
MKSMSQRSGFYLLAIFSVMAITGLSEQTFGVIVTPYLGGGQFPAAPMIHIDIYYNASTNTMTAHRDDTLPDPVLRPLPLEDEFEPNKPWTGLQEKAYNAQYGWNPGGFFQIPLGAAIWIEQTSVDPYLECYRGDLNLGPYTPIFGTSGSSTLWKWSGGMVHNSYAVLRPVQQQYQATYRVYFGNATTGSRVGYEYYDDATVTLSWRALPADYDGSGGVDTADLLLLAAAWLGNEPRVDYLPEGGGDGLVNLLDLEVLSANWLDVW